MITVLPVGTAVGAEYIVVAPLAVCAGKNIPHDPGLPQVTDQSTPAGVVSLLTVATMGAVALTTIRIDRHSLGDLNRNWGNGIVTLVVAFT